MRGRLFGLPQSKFVSNRTRVFATAFERAPAGGVSYPMAWDLANDDIAGVERTALYEEACGSCP